MRDFKSVKIGLFTGCVCISTVFFLGFVGVYIYAQIADPHTEVDSHTKGLSCPHVSFGANFKVTATKIDWGGSVIFFNHGAPYRGGILSLAGDHQVSTKKWDGCGIYFRLIKDARRTDYYWTLMISLWYPIIFFWLFTFDISHTEVA